MVPESPFSDIDNHGVKQPGSGTPMNPAPADSSPNPLRLDLSAPAGTTHTVTAVPAAFTSSTHEQPKKKGGIRGWLAAIGAFLFKFKSLLVALKFGKIFLTFGTMLLSIGAYALLWGWKFATGFVLLIFVHEMGHVFVAWRKKMPVSSPMFIPFMGALITMQKNPRDAYTEAQMGYGGPLFGAIGCTVAWGLSYLLNSPLLLAVANVSMWVNLFNLIPVSPLDGGRIVTAISPRIWLLGLIGMAVYCVYAPGLILILVLIFGFLRLKAQWHLMKTSEYFQVTPAQRLAVTAQYVGLILYLAWTEHATRMVLDTWMQAHGHAVRQIM